MDNDHMSLCWLRLSDFAFEYYRRTSAFSIGVYTAEFVKILSFAEDEDKLSFTATKEGDVLSLTYESQGGSCLRLIPQSRENHYLGGVA